MQLISIIKYVAIYFILLFVETNLLHLISIKNITPDLILIYVLNISLMENRSRATIIGFFSGLIQDVFTTNFFGLSAFSKSVMGFVGVFFQQQRMEYRLLYFMTIFFVLIFFHELIYQLIYSLGGGINFSDLFLYSIVPRTFYTLAVAAIFIFIKTAKHKV